MLKIKVCSILKNFGAGLLMALNVVCGLLALYVMGFVIADLHIVKQYGDTEQAKVCFAGNLVITMVSFILLLVATIGSIGALKNNARMLFLYVALLLIMVSVEILVGAYIAVQRFGVQVKITNWLRVEFYRNVTVIGMEKHLELWDNLQSNYECCGLNSPQDYKALGQPIPVSCCSRAFTAMTDNIRTMMYNSCIELKEYHALGCERQISDMLQQGNDFLIGTAVVAFWLEAGGMTLAMWLLRQLRETMQVRKANA